MGDEKDTILVDATVNATLDVLDRTGFAKNDLENIVIIIFKYKINFIYFNFKVRFLTAPSLINTPAHNIKKLKDIRLLIKEAHSY